MPRPAILANYAKEVDQERLAVEEAIPKWERFPHHSEPSQLASPTGARSFERELMVSSLRRQLTPVLWTEGHSGNLLNGRLFSGSFYISPTQPGAICKTAHHCR